MDLQLLWPTNGTLHVAVDDVVKAKVRHSPAVDVGNAPFVFAWLRSVDDTLLTAEAGVPELQNFRRGIPRVMSWDFSLNITDAGVYLVHFLAVTPSPYANRSNPRAFLIETVHGSPQTLQVVRGVQGVQSAASTSTEDPFPTRACELGVDALRGRWVRSAKASNSGNSSNCRLGCSRDGWTFVSRTCFWKTCSALVAQWYPFPLLLV